MTDTTRQLAEALEKIAAYRPLTFAECADAEAVIGIAESALALYRSQEAALVPVARFDEMRGRPVLLEGAPLLDEGQLLYAASKQAEPVRKTREQHIADAAKVPKIPEPIYSDSVNLPNLVYWQEPRNTAPPPPSKLWFGVPGEVQQAAPAAEPTVSDSEASLRLLAAQELLSSLGYFWEDRKWKKEAQPAPKAEAAEPTYIRQPHTLDKIKHFYGSQDYGAELWSQHALLLQAQQPPSESSAAEPKGWEGAEEWMPLAYELCADECGEEACNELIWTGGPIPEPWGDRWLQYEGEAKRLIALVRKHVPSAQPAQVELPPPDEALALADRLKDRFGATVPTSQAAAMLKAYARAALAWQQAVPLSEREQKLIDVKNEHRSRIVQLIAENGELKEQVKHLKETVRFATHLWNLRDTWTCPADMVRDIKAFHNIKDKP